MAKKKKPSKTTLEYRKQRKRIQSAIKRLEKRGYVFQDDILPQIPKKITPASVKRLQNIDINEIYKSAVKVDPDTGEITPGIVARDKERSKSAKNAKSKKKTEQQKERYANFTDMVIREYINQISRFPPKVAEIVLRKLDEAIQKSGKDNVAYALQYKNESLSEYLNNIALFGDSIQAILAYCDAMFGDLPGMDDESRLEISDIIDSETYSE